MGVKIAVDFGTTNSVVARWDDATATAEIMALPGISTQADTQIPPLVPSLLYVQDGRTGKVLVGEAVRECGADLQRDNRLFRNFKRGLQASPMPPPRQIDGVDWSDGEAGRRFLDSVLSGLAYREADIEQLAISAPVASFSGYLAWLQEALDFIAPDRIRVVDESTAAALGYAVTEPKAVVVVIDLGGGTLDLSVVQLPESREKAGGWLGHLRRGSAAQHAAHVIAKAGRVLGGSDVDQWLLADVLKRCDLTPEALGGDYAALLTRCELAKIDLSAGEATELEFEAAGKTHGVTISRSELEALLGANGFYTALQQVVAKVLHFARRQGVFKEDIHAVLTVGGMSLMPSIQQTLQECFAGVPVRADKPFTAVVEGALQVAAGVGLDDYLAHSYGLRYLNPATGEHDYDEIIAEGSRYPTKKPVEMILAPVHESQQVIELVVGEIDIDAVSRIEVRYEDGQTVFVAQVDSGTQQVIPFNESDPPIVPLPAGDAQAKAAFVVDARRQLHVTVTDLKTNTTLLKDVMIGTLSAEHGESPTAAAPPSPVTGREPRLLTSAGKRGEQRLSVNRLAILLDMVPPESISLDAAAAMLRSEKFYIRYGAAVALRRRGDRAARMVMQEVLDGGEVPARASVARHLHGFSWFAAEPLYRQALADPDSRVREAAVYSLCAMQEQSAYQLMVEALQQEDDEVREAAATGLRNCQDPQAVPVLEAVLLARDPGVRVKALEALGANDTPEAAAAVRRAIADNSDVEVKYAATLSLLEIEGEACLPEVSALIVGSNGAVRCAFLRALFHASNYLKIDVAASQAVDTLLDALEAAIDDATPAARMAAVWPLAWIRHDRAAALLKRAHDREVDLEVKAHMAHVALALEAGTVGAAPQDLPG